MTIKKVLLGLGTGPQFWVSELQVGMSVISVGKEEMYFGTRISESFRGVSEEYVGKDPVSE